MTTEQLTWTDKEWAVHLGCTVHQVAQHRQWLNNNYEATIAMDYRTGKYAVRVSRFNAAPSGHRRVFPLITSNRQFSTERAARSYANTQFIPCLELTAERASMLGRQAGIMQMLHVQKEK